MVSRDMDEYVEYVSGVREPHKWWIFMVIMSRASMILTSLRFIIPMITTDPEILDLLLDWTHIKNRKLIYSAIVWLFINLCVVGTVYTPHEVKKVLYVFEFLEKLKYHSTKRPLTGLD